MPGGNKASFESAAFLGGFRRNEIIKSVSLGHIGLRGVKAGSGSVTYRLRIKRTNSITAAATISPSEKWYL